MFTGHTAPSFLVDRPGPKNNMESEVWPGLLLSSVGVHLYHSPQFTLGLSDEQESDNTSVTSGPQTPDDESIAESVELRNTGKAKKRVKFLPDNCLVQIQEIPARGQEQEYDNSDSSELSFSIVQVPIVSSVPVPVQLNTSVPDATPVEANINRQSDLSISGRSAKVSTGLAGHSVEKPAEKFQRSVVYRSNTGIRDTHRGSFMVTHAIGLVSHNSSPKQSAKVPSNNNNGGSIPKPATVSANKVSSIQQTWQQTPKSPSPVTRKPIYRGKSMGRIRKRVSKAIKEAKAKADSLSNSEQDAETKSVDSPINRVPEIETSTSPETPSEGSPKKSGRPRTGKKSTNIVKNKENSRGDGANKRTNKSNNSFVLQRNGPRHLYKRFNPGDYTGVRSSFSAISSEKTKVRMPSKQPIAADTWKSSTSPKVNVPVFGRVKSAPSKIMRKVDKISEQEEEESTAIKTLNDVSSSESKQSIINSSNTKSNNFIFPEETKFQFPLMTQQKETTSQLVRLDSNMLSLYKKKLYAWHMANGIMPETRVETPCIAPMWETTRHYHS